MNPRVIVRAAESSGVTVLYSEDLAQGQSYGSIRVVNPLNGLASEQTGARPNLFFHRLVVGMTEMASGSPELSVKDGES